MAHTAQSSVITNQDATPIVKVNATKDGGRVRSSYGYLTMTPATAAQSNAFVRVPVRARLSSVKLKNASFGNGAVDVGLYRVNDGAVIDADGIAADIALTANSGEVDMNAISVANRESDLATIFASAITAAGADSEAEVDICLTVATVSTGAATAVGMEVTYVLPD